MDLNLSFPTNDSSDYFPLLNLSKSDDTVFMDNPLEMLRPWRSNPLFFETIIIHSITFTFGLCGNIIVVLALSGNRILGNSTDMFLVSLAVGDICMISICGPLEMYHHFYIGWAKDDILCRISKTVELQSAIQSVLNLLGVSIERLLVIVFPIWSRTLCTPANVLRVVIGVWVLSILLALPIFFTTGTFEASFTNNKITVVLNYCDYAKGHPIIAIYNLLMVFIIPAIGLAICYSVVINALWKSTRNQQNLMQGEDQPGPLRRAQGLRRDVRLDRNLPSTSGTRGRQRGGASTSGTARAVVMPLRRRNRIDVTRWQVIRMLIVVVILFYICWGPRLSMEVVQKYSMVEFKEAVYRTRMYFNLLTFLHASLNPIIYSFMSKKFQKRLMRLLRHYGCLRRINNRASEMAMGPVASRRSSAQSLRHPERMTVTIPLTVRNPLGNESHQTEETTFITLNRYDCEENQATTSF